MKLKKKRKKTDKKKKKNDKKKEEIKKRSIEEQFQKEIEIKAKLERYHEMKKNECLKIIRSDNYEMDVKKALYNCIYIFFKKNRLDELSIDCEFKIDKSILVMKDIEKILRDDVCINRLKKDIEQKLTDLQISNFKYVRNYWCMITLDGTCVMKYNIDSFLLSIKDIKEDPNKDIKEEDIKEEVKKDIDAISIAQNNNFNNKNNLMNFVKNIFKKSN